MNKREMVCYETDSTRIKGIVEKVFPPQTIKEVQQIVKNTKHDIVPRGSGTSLVGGCVPNNSIVIDLSKMNKVTNFLPLRKTVRVEGGITLKELNEKLNSVGFEFPIDPPNNGISTIGGLIARNASGDRSLRYGNARDWIEEIEFVNGKGELIKTSKADLTDVCGMEGITGIIVGATIKLAPLINRTASAFQTDSLDEILSIARKLRNEREVVILELFSPYVSKLLGLPQKYNLIIEFNSDRGKIKDWDYEKITKMRKNVFSKLYSEGYYNFEDPKFFFDKLKEFIIFLEENQIPYIGHLGVGVIHPFFKDKEKERREKVIEYIKKTKALPGKLGIGLTRKYFIDNFQAKIIQRIKTRYDPNLKFNIGKVIDIQGYNLPKKVKTNEAKILEEESKPLSGEEISAVDVLREMNICEEKKENIEKNPEEKMEDFIKEIEEKEKIEIEKSVTEEKGPTNLEIKQEDFKKNTENNENNELNFQEVKDKLKDYKETYGSELAEEKMHKVEEIAKNIPRDIIKKDIELGPLARKEKVKFDYNQIRDIMANKIDNTNKGKVTITDNFERKSSLSDEDKNLINKILGNRYKEDKKQDTGKKGNGDELI